MSEALVIRGRRISGEDLVLIRRLIEQEGHRGRTHLSRRLCQLWQWRQPNGRFREIACRELLRRLDAKGLIGLPAGQNSGARAGYRHRARTLDLFDRLAVSPLSGSLSELRKHIEVIRVQTPQRTELFKDFLEAYHYLGYQKPAGAQLKYMACLQDRPIACLSFGPAAYKAAPRDEFIGWSSSLRQQRLPWVVNNDRFALLPNNVPHLASFLLGKCLRRLPRDWQQVYCHDLAMVETFVEAARFRGCSYAAANWICLGQTQGRGRNDRFRQQALSCKSIWVYQLREDFREILCSPNQR